MRKIRYVQPQVEVHPIVFTSLLTGSQVFDDTMPPESQL